MFVAELVIFVSILWIINYFVQKNRLKKNYKLPPNPPALPILGNLPVFMTDREPYRVMKDIYDRLGPVFSLKMGPGLTVVLSSAEAIREAFLSKAEDFAGRPQFYSISLLSRNNCGIAFGDYSPAWRLHRRTAAVALHNNIRGKRCTPLAGKIVQEVQRLVDDFQNLTGRAVDISDDVNLAILNVICDMCFSQRYDKNDPEFLEILESNHKFSSLLQPGDPIDIIPALKIFPSKKLRLVQEIIDTRDAILQRKYEEHLKTFDPHDIRDMTDAFISTMTQILDENGNTLMTEDHVVMAMWELFTGGYESTFSTLKWALAYLIHYPQVQKKLQTAMAETIGDRLPTWADKQKLPYLEATVLETLRRSSFSSMNGPRRTICDTSVKGFDIPKDTTVFCNLWWVHHNPKYWKEPNSFRPEHFIGSDGAVFKPHAFFPFSIGKRACLGANLAKMQLFSFIGGILQRYSITCPANEPMPNLEPLPGMIRSCRNFKVQLTRRVIFEE